MDLLSLKPQLEAVIPVLHPLTGEPIEGMSYTLAGKTSPEFRAAAREADKQTDAEEKGVDLFAGAIIGWSGFEESGEPLDCDMETKRRILKQYDWLLEQVIDKFRDKETFLPNARNASVLSQQSAHGAQPKSAK
jgi:hypothetical protein